jgi:hypothetical protein
VVRGGVLDRPVREGGVHEVQVGLGRRHRTHVGHVLRAGRRPLRRIPACLDARDVELRQQMGTITTCSAADGLIDRCLHTAVANWICGSMYMALPNSRWPRLRRSEVERLVRKSR